MKIRPRKSVVSASLAILAAPFVLSAQTVSVRVDSARHEISVSAAPFDLPAMDMAMADMPGMEHHDAGHSGPLTLYQFTWPVDGYAKGFRVEVRDAKGALLPRSLLHHLIGINLDRRQFVYSAAERLFAIGKETEAVSLPGALAVPLTRGQRLGFYVAWHNDTGRDVKNVAVRVVMNWVPAAAAKQLVAVMPVYLDVNNDIGGDNTFDVTPGKSSKAFEFTSPLSGRLLAVGDHLHDYGAAVRLDDATTGKVLVRLPAVKDKSGKIQSMPRKFYAFSPLKVEAGHRYRVVAEYENPLSTTLKDGGMGNIVGVIAPDDPAKWPAIDPSDPLFKKDIRSLGVGTWTRGDAKAAGSGQR